MLEILSQLFFEKLGSELTKNIPIAKIYGSKASSCPNGQTDKLGHFWLFGLLSASENFPPKFGSVSFEYFWSLKFM